MSQKHAQARQGSTALAQGPSGKRRASVVGEVPCIHPEMTVLDVVSAYRRTETVFKDYDQKAGVCLCCEALFDTLSSVALRYGLDLNQFIKDLCEVSA